MFNMEPSSFCLEGIRICRGGARKQKQYGKLGLSTVIFNDHSSITFLSDCVCGAIQSICICLINLRIAMVKGQRKKHNRRVMM